MADQDQAQGRSLVRNITAWAVQTEGSSRSSALIRIGLALLLWSRFASELLLYRDMTTPGLALAIAFFVATTMLLVGWQSRLAALLAGSVGLLMYYHFGHGLGREPWTHHHVYLLSVATLLLALTPCGACYSIDRYLAVRRAELSATPPPLETGNLWGLRLIVLQLSALYFYSAFDKTGYAFLSGARLEHLVLWYYAGSDYPSFAGFKAMTILVAWMVVALEYALAFGMPFRATRRWLVLPGLAFHAVIYASLPVYTFSLTMAVLYLAYFDADAVHRLIDRISGAARPSGEPAA